MAEDSDYQMCLAHILLSSRKYKGFYKRAIERGNTVIMDNGACELGQSIAWEKLVECYYEIGEPAVVVIPDQERGNMQVFEKSLQFLDDRIGRNGVKFMACPHGQEDLMEMAKNPRVDIIGINRDWIDRARAIVLVLDKVHESHEKFFHMLGIRKDPIGEVLPVLENDDLRSRVMGIDSSMPYRLGREFRGLDDFKPYPKPIDFEEGGLLNNIVRFTTRQIKEYGKFIRSKN